MLYDYRGSSPGAKQNNEREYRIIGRLLHCYNRQRETVVMGDINGHIGMLGVEVNGNGELLLNFMEEYGFKNLKLNVTIGEGRATWSRFRE